jgi:hypothetical protein
MKLVDLHPQFLGAGGEGIFNADGTPATPREGVGVIFDCPCGQYKEEWQRCYVPFSNPLDGGPVFDERQGWQRTGETFDTLTLTPSILRNKDRGGCGWHGFITNGDIITA